MTVISIASFVFYTFLFNQAAFVSIPKSLSVRSELMATVKKHLMCFQDEREAKRAERINARARQDDIQSQSRKKESNGGGVAVPWTQADQEQQASPSALQGDTLGRARVAAGCPGKFGLGTRLPSSRLPFPDTTDSSLATLPSFLPSSQILSRDGYRSCNRRVREGSSYGRRYAA